MPKTRLIIKTAEITPEGLLIRTISIIDGNTGKEIRVAKITPELLNFLKMVEIGVDDYLAIQTLQKKNPNVKKLCENFKLYT
jgi:hypothetical protein